MSVINGRTLAKMQSFILVFAIKTPNSVGMIGRVVLVEARQSTDKDRRS